MIPQAFITEWRHQAPWPDNDQVEQDLVICRSLIEIFSDPMLAESLAFRGGTALHKLYMNPSPRYSEDIDLVQIDPWPFGPIVDQLRVKLSFLGNPRRLSKPHNFTLVYRFDSEFPPTIPLKLKIETNTREHFQVMGLIKFPFEVQSKWFSGQCELTTYPIEELLGTKLRALYQRKKGRDLFDLYYALSHHSSINTSDLIRCYNEYMKFSVNQPPSKKEFIQNLESKIVDPNFTGDTAGLLRSGIKNDPIETFELLNTKLFRLL